MSRVVTFWVVWSALAAIGRSKLLGDGDTFWHLRVGREIAETGRLPVVDAYSYSAAGRPWLANQWLAEWWMHCLDVWGGLDALLLFFITVLAAYYTWLAERWRRVGADGMVAGLAVAVVFLASAYNLLARPHVATMIGLPVLYAHLLDVESGRRSVRSLAVWPAAFVIWANLHGGVLGGVGTLGLAIAGWLGVYWAGGRSPLKSRADATTVAAAGVASLAALVVNPYGTGMFDAWRRILEMDLPHLIIEHARLDPRTIEGASVLAAGGATAWVLLSRPEWRKRPIAWIPLLWLLMAVSRIRHAPLFAGVAALAVAEALPGSRIVQALQERGFWSGAAANESPGERRRRGRSTAAWVAVPLLLVGVVLGWRTRANRGEPLWARPVVAAWPADLAADLDRLKTPEGRPLRVFNEARYGGYLIYRHERARVYIDGRCELYGEPFLRTYLEARQDAVLRRRLTDEDPGGAADAALVRSDSALDRQLSADPVWRLVRRGREAVLYARSSGS